MRAAIARWAGRRGPSEAGAAAFPGVADLLRSSGLVDEAFYRGANPDVAAAGVDPAVHYAEMGAWEGRNPNAFFDTAFYLVSNPDVAAAGLNPLHHYVAGGAEEGRAAGPGFDTAYYVAQNPEVGLSGMNPLLHYLLHGRDEGRAATAYDEGDAFEVAVRARQLGATGPASGLFKGARAEAVHFPLAPRHDGEATGALPLPPLRLAQRIGSVTLADFDASGRGIRDAIVRALPEGWSWEGKRCLDFGSGVGRALRHFAPEAEVGEFWGCDIDGSSIRWSVQNLSPPFRFFQIGEVPTMPFEDASFDLVCAISVLSHIHTTWHQWLMEIRRILKPGGVVFVTFLGPTPMAEMLGEPYWDRGDDFGMLVRGPFHNWSDGGPMIFISPEWIRRFWGSLFDIDYVAIDGLMDYQSFAILRRPAFGAPICRDAPVLRFGTQQAFDPHAVGLIQPRFDAARPFRDSYGLDVEPRPDVRVEGWVALRGDEAEAVAASVGGRTVGGPATFEAGGPHRDWGTPRVNFAVDCDLSGLDKGEHLFEARVRGRGGRTHALSIPLLVR